MGKFLIGVVAGILLTFLTVLLPFLCGR